MKSTFNAWSLILVIGAFIFSVNSCSDPCNEVVCVNGGTCFEGECECPSGFSGDSCSVETRALYYGTYNVHDVCTQTGISDYTVNVSGVPDELFKIRIANFANAFANYVIATINGNQINIASQDPDGDGRIVTGSGTIGGNTIQMSYSIAGGSSSNVCDESTWIK